MQFFPGESDFDEFTMSSDDLVVYAIHSCSLFVAWFSMALLLFPDDQKRLSWAVSMLNSFAMCASSIVYMGKKLPPEFFALASPTGSVFHGRDNVSAAACLVFGVANAMNLLLGFIFYRDRLNILSSLVYSPMFCFIAFYAITGNFLGEEFTPFSQGLMWMMIEELPTFVLALGSVFPALRTDKLFGVSFFILRIVFHGYSTSLAILSNTDTPVCVLMCIFMVLHVIWFQRWVNRRRQVVVPLRQKTRTTITTSSPAVRPPKGLFPSPPSHNKTL